MSWTARDDDDKREYFDPPDELEKKATELAEWIRDSKHMIVFTGAGISTAAGIPDFRSGMDTQLETGPGVWELQAHGQARSSDSYTKICTQAIPTPTHMMFVKLMQEGLLKAVVSQNCDGLHRRSGLFVKSLYELHGNSNVERCKKCKREYLRDYDVYTAHPSHYTGSRCDDPQCKGRLCDTIINFGENLPEVPLEESFRHAHEADLCLAMGSSLTVTPAADIPQTVGRRQQRLVIVNLQSTPLDDLAAMRVFAKCDDFIRLLMSKLALEIPKFELKRRLFFKTTDGGKVSVEQVDFEGNPFSYLKGVEFSGVVSKVCIPERDLLECELPPGGEGGEVKVRLKLHGHYKEPDVVLSFVLTPGTDITEDILLSYDPFSGQWTTTRQQ